MIPIISTNDALEALYRGDKITSSWLVESCFERDKYNRQHEQVAFNYEGDEVTVETSNILKDTYNINIEDLILDGLDTWFIPDEYKDIDVKEYVTSLCKEEKSLPLVYKELNLFKEKDLFNVLRFLIYLVDHMRKHNLVWGVGRGSSVASYVLYLIGVHKVDSVKYKLQIEEFLR